MTLVEFLEARISDDEAMFTHAGMDWPEIEGYLLPGFTEERALAECAAKRAIIEWHVKTGEQRSHWDGECCEENRGEIEWLEPDEQEISVGTTGSGQLSVRESFATQANLGCTTLRMMAAVWSDHPDFDPAWGTA